MGTRDLVGGGEGVRHEDAKGRGAIEKHVVERLVGHERGKGAAELEHVFVHARHLHLGTGEVEVRGNGGKIFQAGGGDELLDGALADEGAVEAGVSGLADAEGAAGVSLGVEIGQGARERRARPGRRRGLRRWWFYPPRLLVGDGDSDLHRGRLE